MRTPWSSFKAGCRNTGDLVLGWVKNLLWVDGQGRWVFVDSVTRNQRALLKGPEEGLGADWFLVGPEPQKRTGRNNRERLEQIRSSWRTRLHFGPEVIIQEQHVQILVRMGVC